METNTNDNQSLHRVMLYRTTALLPAVCFCLLFSQGCTYRAWYEGFQEQQRQECYKNRGRDETQKCLDRANSITYDEYEKGLENSKKQSK
jgi:hypothetical protein